MRTSLLSLIVVVTLSLVNSLAPAQKDTPASAAAGRPAAYRVRIRFRIDANRQQRYERYQELLKHLQGAGFKKDKGLEGEEIYSDEMTGTIPAAGVEQIFQARAVRTALLVPEGFTLPTEAEKPLLVDLRLTTQFGAGRQQQIASRTRELLQPLKFQEAVGYDGQNHLRLLGWLPTGQLNALFADTFQIDKVPPVRRIEVLSDAEPSKAPPAAEAIPADKQYLNKIAPDLRGQMTGDADAQKPIRVEVILWTTPQPNERAWYDVVTGSMETEGRIGPLITGLVAPSVLEGLAALPEVAAIRRTQPAPSWVFPPLDPKQPAALPVDYVPLGRPVAESRPLAQLMRRHAPQKVAVIAADFNGYEAFVGKQLPAKTSLLDFTAERNPDLQSDPPMPGNEVGGGTRIALAVQATAPADEMLLVRIPADAPYQVEQIANVLHGRQWLTDALARRDAELRLDKKRIDDMRVELRVRRRLALETFSEDETARKAREEYRQMQKTFNDMEKSYADKSGRLLNFLNQLPKLRSVSTVVLGMAWTDGFPNLPGQPPVLRYLEETDLHDAAWIQVVPKRQGQVWTGVFRDSNGGGVMEFAPDGTSTRTDLNFLAWQPADAKGQKPAAELPAKAVVQVSLQWQEVQSPEWKKNSQEDAYRRPLAPLQIVILRQRDPSGKTVPAGLFDVVARTTSWPERLESTPKTAIYELSLRFQVGDEPGRYAVRIEGRQPDSIYPSQAARLPNSPKNELHPKLDVDVLDPSSRQKGRVVFGSFATGE
jgi:hypothetical protein